MSTKIRVTPIAATNVAVDLLLKDSYDLSGHNFAKAADKYGLKNYQKYLMILTEFQSNKEVIDKNSFLKHLFFSFLIFAPSSVILRICELGDLSVTTRKCENGRLALFSGTLEQWKNLLKQNGLNEIVKRELVSLFHKLSLGKLI